MRKGILDVNEYQGHEKELMMGCLSALSKFCTLPKKRTCVLNFFCSQLAVLFGLLWLRTSSCPSQELTALSAPLWDSLW